MNRLARRGNRIVWPPDDELRAFMRTRYFRKAAAELGISERTLKRYCGQRHILDRAQDWGSAMNFAKAVGQLASDVNEDRIRDLVETLRVQTLWVHREEVEDRYFREQWYYRSANLLLSALSPTQLRRAGNYLAAVAEVLEEKKLDSNLSALEHAKTCEVVT